MSTHYKSAVEALATASAAVEGLADENAALVDRVAELEGGQSPGADPPADPPDLVQARVTIRRQAATIEALNAEREVARDRIVNLEAALAAALEPPDPDAGAEQVWHHQQGDTLAETIRAMAGRPITPGGVSTLHVPAGDLGPLAFAHGHGAILWSRTLRIVGPAGATISGDPAISLDASAGDCSGFTLDLWGVGVAGDVVVRGQAGFALRPRTGTGFRSAQAVPVPLEP